MPPRLQCLNMVRNLVSRPNLRMQFSTTRALFADEPSNLNPSNSEPPNSSPVLGNNVPTNSYHSLTQLVALGEKRRLEVKLRAEQKAKDEAADDAKVESSSYRIELSKQITRRWKAGDVYAPHDLTDVEMAKWKVRDRVTKDVFDVVNFNPLDNYKNFAIMSEYMTTMGRIKGRKETGLRGVNQRKIAKAIRRSIGMGLMPSVHKHPEIIYKQRLRAPAAGSSIFARSTTTDETTGTIGSLLSSNSGT